MTGDGRRGVDSRIRCRLSGTRVVRDACDAGLDSGDPDPDVDRTGPHTGIRSAYLHRLRDATPKFEPSLLDVDLGDATDTGNFRCGSLWFRQFL
jgi:hypothetical protein